MTRIVIRLKLSTGGKRVKYVLMFIETEEFAKEFAALGPGEQEEAYRRV